MNKKGNSNKIYDFSKKYLVSGCSSAIRWNKLLKRPLYIKEGQGSRIIDYDNNTFIDTCCSHGASILGHKHPRIIEQLYKAADMGILCSYETEYQGILAKKICDLVPCAELCRFTCSGTEATMNAIRLARDITGKDVILKFEGHFHGYHDYLQYSWAPSLNEAGFYNNPNSVPCSSGMPEKIKEFVKVIPFNNIEILENTIKKYKNKIAAIILEPINYNSGCIVPDKEYMKQMRVLTKNNGIILIYDEILSAFRTGKDCAQGYFSVTPDISTIGKCVAGGTPLSVLCGKKEYMEHLTPIGKCVHSGTYNGHLIAVLSAIATLNEIDKPYFYKHIYKLADKLYKGFNQIFNNLRLNIKVQGLGARFGFYFDVKKEIIREYRDCVDNNEEMNLKFFELMYNRGVYFYGKHNGFSIQHALEDVYEVLNKTEDTIKDLEKIYL